MTFKQTKTADELALLLENELVIKQTASYKKIEKSEVILNKINEASKLLEDIGYFHVTAKLERIATKIVKG